MLLIIALVAAAPALGQNPQAAADYTKTGRGLVLKEDQEAAIASFDKALAHDSDNEADVDRAIKGKVDDAMSFNTRGLAFDAKRDLRNAIADFSKDVS